jgi:hypothetical protein
MSRNPYASLCCSFCGKSQREVRRLIAGPSAYICDLCIETCIDINSEEERRRAARATPGGERAHGAAVVLLGTLQSNFSAFEGAGVPEAERRALQAALTRVELALQRASGPARVRPGDEDLTCSFCGKSRQQVRHLVGTSAIGAICDQCVDRSGFSPEDPERAGALSSVRSIRCMLGGLARAGVPERHRITLGAVADAIAHYLETGED